MPFDTMPAVPQPLPDRLLALKNLAWLLRHPNHWPEGFAWEYTDLDRCAVGLCRQAHGDRAFNAIFGHAAVSVVCGGYQYQGNVPRDIWRLFWRRIDSHRYITPLDIARDIEKYVARQKVAQKDERQTELAV